MFIKSVLYTFRIRVNISIDNKNRQVGGPGKEEYCPGAQRFPRNGRGREIGQPNTPQSWWDPRNTGSGSVSLTLRG